MVSMVKVFLSIGPSPRGQGNKASAGTDPKKFYERPSESGFVRYTTGSGPRKAALKCLTLSGSALAVAKMQRTSASGCTYDMCMLQSISLGRS
jgi:hypothetical protein